MECDKIIKRTVNCKSEALVEIATEKNEVELLASDVLVALTGEHTGRSPNAKYFVGDEITENTIIWSCNNSISPEKFDEKLKLFLNFCDSAPLIHLQQVSAVRDQRLRLNVDVYTEFAKHALFTRNMLEPRTSEDLSYTPDYTLYHFPSLLDEPTVLISVAQKIILISGTLYSGEIKKSVFSVLNYHLPLNGILPMHCSVNTDITGNNAAVFFGLSGTGKTTLSSDPARLLLGDDEHSWGPDGLSNFEYGCYAKTIGLSQKEEPQIWDACHKKHTLLENVVTHGGQCDFDDISYTQNGRASYPLSHIDQIIPKGFVDVHPENIIMLTCDAFGVLPAVAKLTPQQAVKQFLLGYTAKVAGTENGVTEPQATFSPCFGAPFMPLEFERYSKLLLENIKKHDSQCWLVNTGWTGGGYGDGKRISLKATRKIISHILNNSLKKVPVTVHEPTGFTVPIIKGIDETLLSPEKGWDSEEEYLAKASELMKMFEEKLKND